MNNTWSEPLKNISVMKNKQTNKIRMWGNIYDFLLNHDENSNTEVTKNIIKTTR